jgi:hypothetical protein
MEWRRIEMDKNGDETRAMLRHTLATLAYRGSKALRGAPAQFGDFAIGDRPRTPRQILAHMGDLFDWALSIAKGAEAWYNSPPLIWDTEVTRFFETMGRFDAYLASEEPLRCSPERLFQGPIADALTPVGQLAMLRRLAGVSMKGENYFKADIVVGRVGLEQAAPRREFD